MQLTVLVSGRSTTYASQRLGTCLPLRDACWEALELGPRYLPDRTMLELLRVPGHHTSAVDRQEGVYIDLMTYEGRPTINF